MDTLGSSFEILCKFNLLMKQNFSTKHDSFLPSGAKILGGAIGFLGLFAIIPNPILGLALLTGGVFAVCSDQGSDFKPKEKLYRYYIGIFGLHFGRWESYQNYPDMALLSKRMTTSSFSRTNRQTDQTETAHELYLLSSDHRKKILAFVYKNLATAEGSNPKLLAENLGVNYTIYSPKISEQTASKKRR